MLVIHADGTFKDEYDDDEVPVMVYRDPDDGDGDSDSDAVGADEDVDDWPDIGVRQQA